MTDTTDTGFAQAWKPDSAPDTIKGTLVRVSMSADMGYGPYPILTLDTPEGERSVHAFHTVLKSELDRCRPSRGDELEITYLGKKESASGRMFAHYRVVGGNEPEFNWDNVASDGAPVPASQPAAPVSTAVPPMQAAAPAQPTQAERAAETFGGEPPF